MFEGLFKGVLPFFKGLFKRVLAFFKSLFLRGSYPVFKVFLHNDKVFSNYFKISLKYACAYFSLSWRSDVTKDVSAVIGLLLEEVGASQKSSSGIPIGGAYPVLKGHFYGFLPF